MLKFSNNDETQVQDELPWLVFKLHGLTYAVNSNFITSIGVLPEVTPMPEAPAYIRGIITLREEVIPMVDLRMLFNLPGREKELENFQNMLSGHYKEHVDWARTLKECVKNKQSFSLSTNPHKCSFGRWYDSFESDNTDVAFALKKMESPHKNLHEAAAEIQKLLDHGEDGDGKKIQSILGQIDKFYLPQISDSMDQAAAAMRDHRTMMIILQIDNVNIGVIVDEVCCVEQVTLINDDTAAASIYRTRYVSSIGKCDRMEDLIGLLDEQALSALAQSLKINSGFNV